MARSTYLQWRRATSLKGAEESFNTVIEPVAACEGIDYNFMKSMAANTNAHAKSDVDAMKFF